MKKRIVVALAALATGLMGLFAVPAQGLQYGFSANYSTVGFQLHGGGVEFLLGLQDQDQHRPIGSVVRVGFAGATGTGESDLTKALWNGVSFAEYQELAKKQLAAQLLQIAQSGIPPAQIAPAIAAATQTAITTQEASEAAYGITDYEKVEGEGTAFFISLAYEYVLPKGVPGLGIFAGGELYISQGNFESSNPAFPSVKTEGGIGGGGIVGVSYYLKNGLNFAVRTGLGVVDPGKVTLLGATLEPESVFYVSPSVGIGYTY